MWEVEKPKISAGMAIVDCHTHSYFSGDSNTTIERYVDSFEKSGLTHAFITDHQSISAYPLLKERLGNRILCGQEQRVKEGEVMGLCLSEKIPPGLTLEEASKRIRDQGGLVYLCHPLDPNRVSVQYDVMIAALENNLIDAIELCNSKSLTFQASLRDLAKSYAVAVLGGSDSHVPNSLGSSGAVMPWFETSETFALSITMAVPFGRHCDPPKSWPIDIVPPTQV